MGEHWTAQHAGARTATCQGALTKRMLVKFVAMLAYGSRARLGQEASTVRPAMQVHPPPRPPAS